MPRKTYRPEEIIAKLCEAEVLIGQDPKAPEFMRGIGPGDVRPKRWIFRTLPLHVTDSAVLAGVAASARSSAGLPGDRGPRVLRRTLRYGPLAALLQPNVASPGGTQCHSAAERLDSLRPERHGAALSGTT